MKIDIGRNKKQARMERKKQKKRILKTHLERKKRKRTHQEHWKEL